MERHYHDVGFLSEIADNPLHVLLVGMLQCVRVVAEGAESVSDAVAFHYRTFLSSADARICYAVGMESGLGGFHAVETEIEGMVVRHAHEVETGIGNQFAVAGWHTEGVAEFATLLRRLPLVGEGALHISCRHVGSCQDAVHILEERGAVFLRQTAVGECSARHYVAHEGKVQCAALGSSVRCHTCRRCLLSLVGRSLGCYSVGNANGHRAFALGAR